MMKDDMHICIYRKAYRIHRYMNKPIPDDGRNKFTEIQLEPLLEEVRVPQPLRLGPPPRTARLDKTNGGQPQERVGTH